MKQQQLDYREELITPEMAKTYLGANKVNRNVKESKVAFYARQMKDGKWRMNGEAICFLKGGALGNGQHRLLAVIASNTPTKFLVVRGCDEDSFLVYDSGANRTAKDVFQIEDTPNAANISAIVARYFALQKESVGVFSTGVGKMSALSVSAVTGKTKEDLLDEYNSTPNLYQDACQIALQCYRKTKILKITEIGALYVFLIKYKKYAPELVESFFKQLFNIEKCNNTTINALQSKLINDKLNTQKLTSAYRYNLIVKTWNYYVQGKNVQQLVWNESKEGKLRFM